jgi:hypothetical protein
MEHARQASVHTHLLTSDTHRRREDILFTSVPLRCALAAALVRIPNSSRNPFLKVRLHRRKDTASSGHHVADILAFSVMLIDDWH